MREPIDRGDDREVLGDDVKGEDDQFCGIFVLFETAAGSGC